MPEKNLAALLHIHPRTINNYKQRKKVLNPVEGEHLLKLIQLFTTGEEIFGSIDPFNQWLNTPGWQDKQKPMDWLDTHGRPYVVRRRTDEHGSYLNHEQRE